MAHNGYDGLEHGVLNWLPPQHAPVGRGYNKQQQQTKEQFGVGVRRHGIKSPPSAEEMMFQQGQSRRRARNQANWASSGPGMQAIFLGSNPKTSGTGVFIPRKDGAEFTNKPAFSPVLLPSRVVQALNLNVHELGQPIKAKPEVRKDTVRKTEENIEEDDETDVICVSPDIYLPKEWTY
ncbi:hypothetical protein ABFS83_04G027300 [Erythranthe nasuta]